MNAWLVVIFFFSFYSQAILSGTDVWYSSFLSAAEVVGPSMRRIDASVSLTAGHVSMLEGDRHQHVPFNFPLLFQGNNTNFSVLENLPRNHNLTLLFPNDFWFVQSIFFFPLSLSLTHTHTHFFYLLLFQNSANKWMLSFLSQMAWKFSTRSSSIRLSIGLHGIFSWIFAMLVICKSGHANVLVGPRSSWRSGKGHWLGGSAQGLRCRIQGSEVFFEISLSKKMF